jgi:hypothetical protein
MDPLRRASASGLAVAVALAVIAVIAGCASTTVANRRSEMREGEKLARPDRILIEDFGATPADVAADSAIAARIAEPETPPTEEQLEVGRRLGAEIASKLSEEIRAMGLPGQLARESAPPNPGDLVIKGYFGSIDEGSAVKRIVIGFGSGGAELQTFVEGYLATATGLRRLGSGEVSSGAGGTGRTPGVLVPLAVTIATANPIGIAVGGAVKAGQELTGSSKIDASAERTAELIAKELKVRFQEQGWIE